MKVKSASASFVSVDRRKDDNYDESEKENSLPEGAEYPGFPGEEEQYEKNRRLASGVADARRLHGRFIDAGIQFGNADQRADIRISI